MKKVAVAFLAMALLMLFSVVPVMAKTEKVPATINVSAPTDYVYGPRAWFNPNEFIFQERGTTITFDILDIDIGGPPHTGVWISTLDAKVNFRTGTWVGHFDTVFTLDGSTDDGFAGNIQIVQYLYDGYYTAHGVLQGFGVHDKQTLIFTYDGPQEWPAVWTGYCLKG